MGNSQGVRKRSALEISQDETGRISPPLKRRRLLFDEPSPSSSCGRSSTSNTVTSEDSFGSGRKKEKRRRRLSLSRLLSLSTPRIDHDNSTSRSIQSVNSHGRSDMSHTVSLTSLSHRRDFPTPWLEALFLPSFPSKTPHSLSEKSFIFYEELGRGSFGYVRRAQLRGPERRMCAVKIQEKSAVLMRKYVDRANQEIEILRRLPPHPFIVHLYASWQTRTRLFSCFEYPNEGCDDLFSIWRECGTLSEAAVQIITAELASALDFLHRNSVIYRDLKLENVLVDGEGHMRLADFGMSKTLALGERTHTICGTLQYMAPEVAADLTEGYSHSADWWSLAVVAHTLLTGRYPYPNAECTHHSQLVYIDYSTPPGRSIQVSDFLDSMLHRRLDRRVHDFQSLQALLFFASIDWDYLLVKKYSLLPHIDRCQRLARRRKKMRRVTFMTNDDTDDESEDFSGFTEQYEFNPTNI